MAIMSCTCKHTYQDEKYGQQKRVHNRCGVSGRTGSSRGWRCSVCSSTKDDGKK